MTNDYYDIFDDTPPALELGNTRMGYPQHQSSFFALLFFSVYSIYAVLLSLLEFFAMGISGAWQIFLHSGNGGKVHISSIRTVVPCPFRALYHERNWLFFETIVNMRSGL